MFTYDAALDTNKDLCISDFSLFSAAINECKLELDNCHPNATCTDVDEGFVCTCQEGFVGDGVECGRPTLNLLPPHLPVQY